MPESETFVGVDVSKAHLDVGVSGSQDASTFSNSERGISDLVQWLGELCPLLVVLEATGGFEVPAAAALAALGEVEETDEDREAAAALAALNGDSDESGESAGDGEKSEATAATVE